MLRISRNTLVTIICGILSGGLFSAVAANAGSGILVLFLPVLPLASVGLSLSARHCFFAALAACITIAFLSDVGYILFFVLFIVFPLLHFVRKLLLWRDGEAEREWYPVLAAIAEITLMSAGIFMTLALTLVHSEHMQLKTVVAEALSAQLNNDQLDNADPNIGHFLKLLADQWSFLVFAAASWVWVLLFYAFVVMANTLLTVRKIALRPSLALAPEGLPVWLPAILMICAVLAFLGQGNDRFAGETVFLIMLLPYFLSGVASVHKVSLAWSGRKLWLVLFYLLLTLFPLSPWLFALLVAKGVYTQMEKIWTA